MDRFGGLSGHLSFMGEGGVLHGQGQTKVEARRKESAARQGDVVSFGGSEMAKGKGKPGFSPKGDKYGKGKKKI